MVQPSVLASAAVLLAALGLAAWRLPVTPRTVIATGPWTVAAAAVAVASLAGRYEGLGVLGRPSVLVATVALLAVALWAGLVAFASVRGVPFRDRYLAVTGTGAAAVLTVTFAWSTGLQGAALLLVVVLPVAAAVPAIPAVMVLGLLRAEPLTRLRFGAMYVVWAVLFEGLASAAATEFFAADGAGVVTGALRAGLRTAGVAASGWVLVPGHLLVGLLAIVVLGRLATWRPWAGAVGSVVVAAIALWSGTVVLLAAATLG